MRGDERQTLSYDTDGLSIWSAPALALVGGAVTAFLLLDVVEIAEPIGPARPRWPTCTSRCPNAFIVDGMLTSITYLPRDDRWSALARAALRHDVYAALASITLAVLRVTDPELPASERMEQWEQANSERVARTRGTVAEALSRETPDLATLSVALRVMRGLPS